MHPDDKAPPAPKKRRPKFPAWSLGLVSGSLAGFGIAISDADSWSLKWWSIITVAALFWLATRWFCARLVSWFLGMSIMKMALVVEYDPQKNGPI